uniref:retinoic acid receptor responder protein 1 n=1 Tax=Euleptes europaea TaxID=460621 RepID=UPI00253F827C|nr:retinoic acid receptor responder protein 1 [Euleptes europaea]
MPTLQAPRGRPHLLLLAPLLLLLLAFWPAPAVARPPPLALRTPRQPGAGLALAASSPAARRVAQTAVHYYNFQRGSPSALRAPGHVKKASLKVIPGLGRKYIIVFGTKDLQTGENLGPCYAYVFYQKEKPHPFVEIFCSPDQNRTQHLEQDYALYHSLRGDKKPSLERLWSLGDYGSSFIAWQSSTEDLAYTLTLIKHVQPWKREDDSLEFDYNVLLSDVFTEASLSCHMRIVWRPGQPAQVKYDCSSEDGSTESADGSGAEFGSTEGFFGSGNN